MLNVRLYDILTRHQLYLEGIKRWKARQFDGSIHDLAAQINLTLSTLQTDKMGNLTKAELTALISKINRIQADVYNPYLLDLSKWLRSFLTVDNDVVRQLYTSKFDRSVTDAAAQNGNGLYGLNTALGSKSALDRLYSSITTTPMGVGITMAGMFANFANISSSRVVSAINAGYARNDNVSDVLAGIIGTRGANFNDGVLSRIFNNNSAAVGTAIQHTSATNQSAVASVFSNQYRYTAILDDVTTELCESLDGNIYTYGEGPIPPLHYNCRSSAVPLTGQKSDDGKPPRGYSTWIDSQPTAIQDRFGTGDKPQVGLITIDLFQRSVDTMLAA